MLKIAVCDNNKTDMETTIKLIQEWHHGQYSPEIKIRKFCSPYHLLDSVSDGEAFDVFLLDILMPEMSGITLGEQLSRQISDPLIVYLSSSRDYYPDAFRVYAFNYICKPISRENLFPVLDKIACNYERRRDNIFLLKTSDGMIPIPYHTIVYAELLSHICYFHLADGKIWKSQYLRSGFGQFLASLLKENNFIQTHSSFVVNLNFSNRLTSNTLHMTDGSAIPVSRSYTAGVKQEYVNYWLRECNAI